MTSISIRLNGLVSDPGKREIKRFLKFAVVGAWGFIVDFAVLNILMFGAHFPPWLANTCSFTIAVLNTFILNRWWTFPESRQRPVAEQFVQFFTVNVFGYAINQLVFLGSHELLWGHLFVPTVAWNLSKATASAVALFWNFGVNRLWTWRGL